MTPLLLQVQEAATPLWMWAAFALLVVTALVIDLGFFHRHSHRIGVREALKWVCVWVSLAVLFNIAIILTEDWNKGLLFINCYLVELGLSVDNLFVFFVIFFHFAVPSEYQYRVLFWGILLAVVMRLLFIFVGIELVERFNSLYYVFGILLIVLAFKLLFEREPDPEKNFVLRMARKLFPVTQDFHGEKFFVREGTALKATPLFLVFVVINFTDLIFAVDSVPAVIGFTTDRFIAFTSNIFAILGLRAMYFVLVGMLDKFHYLKYGLSLILVFIGVKLLLHSVTDIGPGASLVVVVGLLSGSVALSLLYPPKRLPLPPEDEESAGRDSEEDAMKVSPRTASGDDDD